MMKKYSIKFKNNVKFLKIQGKLAKFKKKGLVKFFIYFQKMKLGNFKHL